MLCHLCVLRFMTEPLGSLAPGLLQCELRVYFAVLTGCRCMASWQGGFITWGSSLDALHNH